MYIQCSSQVHPEVPNEFQIAEWNATDGIFEARKPVWTHLLRSSVLGTVVWAKNLFESSRERLYNQVVGAVLKQVELVKNQESERLCYALIQIAGDGRCGWRAFLAATDPTAFQKVPRSQLSPNAG